MHVKYLQYQHVGTVKLLTMPISTTNNDVAGSFKSKW